VNRRERGRRGEEGERRGERRRRKREERRTAFPFLISLLLIHTFKVE